MGSFIRISLGFAMCMCAIHTGETFHLDSISSETLPVGHVIDYQRPRVSAMWRSYDDLSFQV